MEQLLLETRDLIATHPTVMATLGVAVALVAAVVTRLVDQSSLNQAEERLASYQDEVRRLNDAKADLIHRLEQRGDDLRRIQAELSQRSGAGAT